MIKKVHVKELQKGMFVSAIDRHWFDTPFPTHRFRIKSKHQIEQLRKCCQYVSIDTEKSTVIDSDSDISQLRSSTKTLAKEAIKPPAEKNEKRAAQKQWKEELNQCKTLYLESRTVLNNVLKDVRLGRSLNTEKTKEVIQSLTISIVRHPDSMLFLAQLKEKGYDLAQKSVNVCILTLTFARHIGIPKNKLEAIGLGALLHDIGMVHVPKDILSKRHSLTPSDRKLLKMHPKFGLDIMAKAMDLPEEVREIVAAHHERMDGSGYPKGLKDRQISLFARMVAITSVYEAMTRERYYKTAVSPSRALQTLYNLRHKSLDPRLVEKFIQALGVYPVGCLVKTNDGKIAIVKAASETNRSRPVLQLLLDSKLNHYKEASYLDLCGVENSSIKIVSTCDLSDPRISVLIEPIIDELHTTSSGYRK
ncbi:HD-GYP domain-containing protein [Motiliproteus sp. MSK22-1]|uniref:HD-GYP domain-containing protein n=1 Tax=Motiliproteus sp. MSK22-1 TaxID=1897630 RepID=UPI000976194B|nr:HD-GYP domain-containing protein [Motiliproteus sp. MSK22-1]OMH32631.1 hypothetical protein BGP75_13855 [Motiliproteus sp. MSK22-1]